MLSSRCNDELVFRGTVAKLSAVRQAIKDELQSERLFGFEVFEVWINEDAPPAPGSEDSWEHCLHQVQSADVILVLYNGNSGWSRNTGEIGICHAELQTALSTGSDRVRLIELPLVDIGTSSQRMRNDLFRKYVDVQGRFRTTARTGEEVIEQCRYALRDATAAMARLGVRESQRGRYNIGDALDWSRLDFTARKRLLEETVRTALTERAGANAENDNVFVNIDGRQVLALIHGVPAGMSIAAAREMVGQPFLHDYEYAPVLGGKRFGPIHILACHRGVTETQAIRHIGFPDATVVKDRFGVYLADNVQKIQVLFLQNCRDETSTRHALQRAFEWLSQSGEEERLATRAVSRTRIVLAIAKELNAPRVLRAH